MDIDNSRCRIMEEELAAFWPQWHVSKLLSGGDSCEVFEIFRDNLGVRTYSALKVLRTDSTGNDDIPEAFTNEIQIMEALRGAPNIVLIEDFYFRKGDDTSSLYVRMELLKSFADMMNTNQWTGTSFTIAEVLKVGKDICTALSFCEQKGIIHGDISPENLYVDDFGNYKVGDFGASTQADSMHPAHTAEAGTVSYMAPEIYAGRSYDSTADIYALGLVLYQLLYGGRMPFLPANDQYTGQDIDDANARRLRGEELPSLAGLRVCNDKISAQLDSIIRKACAPDSSMRYQTAKEFYDALSAPEAVADDTDGLSIKRQTAETVSAKPDQRSGQENRPGSAAPAETEKVPVQEEAVTPQTPLALLAGGTAHTRLIFVCAAIVLAVVLIIIGVSSKSGHKDPIQTASAESETGAGTDNDNGAASDASALSASTENKDSTKTDIDESPVSEESDQSISTDNEDNSEADNDDSVASEASALSASTENEDSAKTDTDESPVSEESDQSVSSESENIDTIDEDGDPVLKAPVQAISLNCQQSAAIDENGSLWAWGHNSSGMLGDGTFKDRHKPVKIMDDVQSVSLGWRHSAAIKKDGSLWLWGDNDYGELGDGTTKYRPEPVKIMDDVLIMDDVQSVSLGMDNSAAIKTDGSLWLWGHNRWGDGTDKNWLEPIKIMDDVQSVSLGMDCSAVIKTDGSLWLWGDDSNGQLGDGNHMYRHEPVKIMDDVQSVSLGKKHSAAIKKDGSLWVWGDNYFGKLGDGTNKQQNEPIKIMDDVQSVSLGEENSAAIKTDGSLWVWGDHKYRDWVSYKPISIMSDMQSVSLGWYHSAAIKKDGSLWIWGKNKFGQLGDGTTEDRLEPICIIK